MDVPGGGKDNSQPFGPACALHLTSSLILSTCTSIEGLALSKTHSFLCFQIIHIPRRHLALWERPLVELPSCLIAHCCSCSFCLGSRSTLLVSRPMNAQICLANTQSIISCCCMVSSCWLHNGHEYWWGSPRRASLSEVQHLFLSASQEKNRHRLGALVC